MRIGPGALTGDCLMLRETARYSRHDQRCEVSWHAWCCLLTLQLQWTLCADSLAVDVKQHCD